MMAAPAQAVFSRVPDFCRDHVPLQDMGFVPVVGFKSARRGTGIVFVWGMGGGIGQWVNLNLGAAHQAPRYLRPGTNVKFGNLMIVLYEDEPFPTLAIPVFYQSPAGNWQLFGWCPHERVNVQVMVGFNGDLLLRRYHQGFLAPSICGMTGTIAVYQGVDYGGVGCPGGYTWSADEFEYARAKSGKCLVRLHGPLPANIFV